MTNQLQKFTIKTDTHSRILSDFPFRVGALWGRLLFITCILCSLFSTYANDIITMSSSVLLLDGVNFREHSLQQPKDLLTLLERPLTYSIDTMEVLSEENIAQKPLITLLADLSSETGEPLFLRMTGGDSPNREHGTYGNIKINIPRIHAQLSGCYRHLGMYADAIELYCVNYENARLHSLPYRDIGHYGVAEYIIGQLNLKIQSADLKTVFNQYGEWITVPGLYNPLYRYGNAAVQNLTIPLGKSQLYVSGMIDQRTLSTDHACSLKKTYYNVNSKYKREFLSKDTLSAGIQFTNEKVKGHHAGLEYKHTAELYNVCLSAGLWGNGKPDAKVVVSVPFFDSSDVSAMYALVYIPEERAINQITPENIVSTQIRPFNYNEVRLSTNFRKCFNTPLSVELWTDYKSSYQSYNIDVLDSVILTRFGNSDEKMFLSGGALRFALSFETISLKLWGSGNILLKGAPYEYVPFECGTGFTHFFRGITTIQTDFNLTLRGPVHWNAKYSGRDSTRTSSRLLFCDFGIKVPFILPVLSSHISPEIVIKGGPVCLYPSGRQRFHPFGSKLGPLVSVKLTGNIY